MTTDNTKQYQNPYYDIWKKDDPRYSIGKRATIVILRPNVNDGGWEPGIGYVDTKNDWVILTSFEGRGVLTADDSWDQDWAWTWAPEPKG
jgi:hypothetical protein